MTAHEWLLELVQAAEELGYQVQSVGPHEIRLSVPNSGGYLDVTLKGISLSGELLRSVLVPVEPRG